MPDPMTKDKPELRACRACGAPCSVQTFSGPHIGGVVKLWMCSQHKRTGGNCPSDLAYFDAEAWNDRPPVEPEQGDGRCS